MPIQLPNLDDRTYADLLAEMRALIPGHAPEWTDHNESDPGIMLLELFAWLTESLIYRTNRIPDASKVRFLELLGVKVQPAQPARVELRLTIDELAPDERIDTETGLPKSVYIDAGTPLVVYDPPDFTPRAFVTTREVNFTLDRPQALLQVRPARRAAERLGASSGKPHQAFRLGKEFVLADPPPQVRVGDESWTYRATLVGASPDDPVFTVDPRLNAICFGDEREEIALPGKELKAFPVGGRVPPAGAPIHATYAYTLASRDVLPDGLEFRFDASSPELPDDIRDLLDDGAVLTLAATSSTAAQGAGPTDLEEARHLAIRELRKQYRAVNEQDFEQLVLRDFSEIIRARCLTDVDLSASKPYAYCPGHVSLVIVPKPKRKPVDGSEPIRPEPYDDLKARVSEYLNERRLITCRPHVVEPRYVDVWIEAEVIQLPRTKQNDVRQNIMDALAVFFSPVPRGPNVEGWPFGRHVLISEIHQAIEETPGVDHVETLVARSSARGDAGQIEDLHIGPDMLVQFDAIRTESALRVHR
jgi:hypothetical protein